MKLDIVWTTQFKKDYKQALKRRLNIDLLDDVIRALSRGEKLPAQRAPRLVAEVTLSFLRHFIFPHFSS